MADDLDGKVEMCLGQFLGYNENKKSICYGCTIDRETFRHPNNFDCKYYKSVTINKIEVVK